MANTLSVANFKQYADNIAYALGLVLTAYGDEATSDTVRYGVKLTRDDIVAHADPDDWDIEADLLPAIVTVASNYTTVSEQAAKWASFVSALQNHLAPASTLAAWMVANDVRVHPNWRYVYPGITADCVFWPTASTLATVAVTGSGTGDYTDGVEIDTTLYAGAQLEVVSVGAIGAADILVTVTGVDEDGSADSLPETTLPNGSPDATAVAIGTIADRLVDVTSIAFTGGTAGDDFIIRSKIERTIALA